MSDDEDQNDGMMDEGMETPDTGEESKGMEFESMEKPDQPDSSGDGLEVHAATELEPVYDVPVNVQAVLGKSFLEVSQLLKLGPGAVVELDRKVGEAIDIYVNDRLVARGEVVLIDEHLGVTMTEIIKGDRI